MKSLKHTLALTVTVLYTSMAYAGGHTDEISASFERGINRESSAFAVASISGEADSVNAFINNALSIIPGTDGGAFNVAWNAAQDPVLASFERDINREPPETAVASVNGEADPVNAIINAALSTVPGTAGGTVRVAQGMVQDPVLASFERDLYREPPEFAVASVEGGSDPVNALINAALGVVSDPVLASFVRDLYHEPSAFKAALARGETDPMGAFKNAVSSVIKQERLTLAFTTA